MDLGSLGGGGASALTSSSAQSGNTFGVGTTDWAAILAPLGVVSLVIVFALVLAMNKRN